MTASTTSTPFTRTPRGLRRAALLITACLALLTGHLAGAAPASASTNLGPVTVTSDGTFLTFSPPSLVGAVGDTFTVVNSTSENLLPIVLGSTGGVSVGGTRCDVGQGTCLVNAGPTYTITTLGSINFVKSDGSSPPSGLLILEAAGAGGGGSIDPALVYPTAYLNANQGTCTGTMQFTKMNGQNGTVTLPTAQQCTRTNYSFLGWARSATATAPDFTSTVPIGNESFTLYAVWRPNGILVTYDANVGVGTQCLLNGVNVVDGARRTTPTVVAVGSSSASSPPCTPPGHVLDGWRLTGNGVLANRLGSALDYPSGSSLTLFAQWRSIVGIPATITITRADGGAVPTSVAAGSSTAMVVTAKDAMGGPATLSPIEISVTGDATFLLPGWAKGLTRQAAWPTTIEGAVVFFLDASKEGSFTITATAVQYPTVTTATPVIKVKPDRFDLSLQVDSLFVNSAKPLPQLVKICAGVSKLVTFTATKNGVAAAGQIIDVEITRAGGSPRTQKLTTDDSGRVQVNFKLDPNYAPQVVKGSFANQVAELAFTQSNPDQCVANQ